MNRNVLLLPLHTQVESSLAVQSLKPRVDMIKARYGNDKDKIQRETQLLYKQAGVNPLAGRARANMLIKSSTTLMKL
jgi:YidC/Oxa1 family membrane protein insertase